MSPQEIPRFSSFPFSHGDISHTVYVGGQGPGVLLIHELPGMVPQCVDFAVKIIEQGFTVFMPLLFGEPNAVAATARNFIHVCVSREFKCFATNTSSPVTTWLRALCVEQIRPSCPGQGIGAIGMCLTGGFVLSLFVPHLLLAPVLSQPALPFALLPGSQSALGVDQNQLSEVVNSSVNVVGFRFQGDRFCPSERFQTLHTLLGDRFEDHELPGNQHSVLTIDFVNNPTHPTYQARERVFGFLREQLM